MCGFTCIFEKTCHHTRDYSGMVSKMLREISHRGPDEQKIHLDTQNGVYIGFCRLSMVDIKMSMQPFWDNQHKIAIIFNGEIYNYKTLRKEFDENSFWTNGEVELLLKLYKRYGESFVKKLDGMFALCVIDLLNGVVFAARDKQGIKPLYYYENHQFFMFASELKAIRAVIPLNINHKAIEMYFSYRFIPAPYTVYNDVFKLKAGEQITLYVDGGVKKKQYSKYNVHFPEIQYNAGDCEKIIKSNILSTYDHSDVPIGLFLSGGIDSGIVASVLRDRLRSEGKVFHIEYPGSFVEIPEEKSLLQLISETGIKCDRIVFDDSILDIIEHIIFSLDEPFYSTVSASTYALSKNAKKTVKGVLTGDGSDELIYGYRYLREAIHHRDPYQAYLDGIGWLKYINYRSLLEAYSLHNDDISHILFSDCMIQNNAPETLRRVEVFKRLPDYHLMRIDRLTMAFGIEARLPYLRNECVEMFLGIKSEMFLKSDVKGPIKRAFSSSIPSVLLQTEKQPFYAPIKKWIEGSLCKDIKKTFINKDIVELLHLNYKAIGQMISNYHGSYADVSNIWGMYLLLKWGQKELQSRRWMNGS